MLPDMQGEFAPVTFGTLGMTLTGCRVYGDRRARMYSDKVEVLLPSGRQIITCPAGLVFPHQTFDLSLMQD